MRRFIATPTSIFEHKAVIDNPREVNHIKNVLRMEEGDSAIITDSLHYEYDAVISTISSRSVIFDLRNKRESDNDPKNHITLFQCMPKQGKLDLIVQKTVELGVHEIYPVYSARSIVRRTDSDYRKTERWNNISTEAVKQCGRTHIPVVHTPIQLSAISPYLDNYEYIIMPYENEKGITLKGILKEIKLRQTISDIAVIIGPEGGFTEDEEKLITSNAAFTCSLGKTILRTETAAIATIAMIMYELELDLP